MNSSFSFPWPEIEIQETEWNGEESPQERIAPMEKQLRSAFFGKNTKFLTYFPYLSTDFTGAFRWHSFRSSTTEKNTFCAWNPENPPVWDSQELFEIWELKKATQWQIGIEEGLWGFVFLYEGDTVRFQEWLEKLESIEPLSRPLRQFLVLLGWRNDDLEPEDSLLGILVQYSKEGKLSQEQYSFLSEQVLREGYIQFSGILTDAIAKGLWSGEATFSFWQFATSTWDHWKAWEKAKWEATSVGKLPPRFAMDLFRPFLSPEKQKTYLAQMRRIFRGEDPEESVETLLLDFVENVKKNPEETRKQVDRTLEVLPFAYFTHLQKAILEWETGNSEGFASHYQKSGRLRYLALALQYQAKYLHSKGNLELSEQIARTIGIEIQG